MWRVRARCRPPGLVVRCAAGHTCAEFLIRGDNITAEDEKLAVADDGILVPSGPARAAAAPSSSAPAAAKPSMPAGGAAASTAAAAPVKSGSAPAAAAEDDDSDLPDLVDSVD